MNTAQDFLAHLIGSWDLQGQMGETPLHQQVECRWTLGGLFVEVYCRSVLAEPPGIRPYEAVYHIGYNAEHDRYAMHLLDTTGVALTCAVGVGKREEVRQVEPADHREVAGPVRGHVGHPRSVKTNRRAAK